LQQSKTKTRPLLTIPVCVFFDFLLALHLTSFVPLMMMMMLACFWEQSAFKNLELSQLMQTQTPLFCSESFPAYFHPSSAYIYLFASSHLNSHLTGSRSKQQSQCCRRSFRRQASVLLGGWSQKRSGAQSSTNCAQSKILVGIDLRKSLFCLLHRSRTESRRRR
jgi:hypothetical protein